METICTKSEVEHKHAVCLCNGVLDGHLPLQGNREVLRISLEYALKINIQITGSERIK